MKYNESEMSTSQFSSPVVQSAPITKFSHSFVTCALWSTYSNSSIPLSLMDIKEVQQSPVPPQTCPRPQVRAGSFGRMRA